MQHFQEEWKGGDERFRLTINLGDHKGEVCFHTSRLNDISLAFLARSRPRQLSERFENMRVLSHENSHEPCNITCMFPDPEAVGSWGTSSWHKSNFHMLEKRTYTSVQWLGETFHTVPMATSANYELCRPFSISLQDVNLDHQLIRYVDDTVVIERYKQDEMDSLTGLQETIRYYMMNDPDEMTRTIHLQRRLTEQILGEKLAFRKQLVDSDRYQWEQEVSEDEVFLEQQSLSDNMPFEELEDEREFDLPDQYHEDFVDRMNLFM